MNKSKIKEKSPNNIGPHYPFNSDTQYKYCPGNISKNNLENI